MSKITRPTVLAAIILASCARATTPGTSNEFLANAPPAASPSPTATPALYDQMQIDWTNPIQGEAVASVAAAAPSVAFTVYEPQGLPAPSAVFLTPASISTGDRAIALVYRSTPFGWIDVVEHVPPETGKAYEAMHQELVALNGGPYTHGSFQLVPLPDGSQALLTVSEDGKHATAFWMRGDAELVLEGPDLTPDQAIKLLPTI
jgi:hypothetical protein